MTRATETESLVRRLSAHSEQARAMGRKVTPTSFGPVGWRFLADDLEEAIDKINGHIDL
jgi:predicted small metal-binding protein